MGDPVPGDAQSRELHQKGEAEEPDERESLCPTLVTSAALAYVLEDTPPSPTTPRRRERILGLQRLG